MVDEASDSGPSAAARTSLGAGVPHGFSVRHSPAGLTGHWHDVIELGDGRTGVLVGCCPGGAGPGPVRSAARATLIRTADPVQSLSGVSGSGVSALCAVIDGATIGYSSRGGSDTVVAEPEAPTQVLTDAQGRLVVAPLRPGATVLLCTGRIGPAAAALDGCEAVPPEQVADQVMARLAGAAGAGVAAVVYRHPPEPLCIALPAEPANLAVGRGLLRQWLGAAGVDPESCADLVLAVGEATANATEHAVVGAVGQVTITVTASITGSRLSITVADTGVWKPASAEVGHRGHGIPLINALVDSAELTSTPEGTTVAMVKELRR